jgi:Sortase domain
MAAAPVPSRRRRRLVGLAAVGSGAAAAMCGLAAVVAGSSPSVTGPDELIPPASLAVAPSTVPPRTAPASPSAPARTAVPTGSDAAITTPTTLPLSPLGSLVGEAVSAQPVPPLADVAPTAITIGAIGVDAPVRSVGIAPDGQLEVPDETHVGWYRHGAAPGQPGASVLAAHVSWHDRAGPFLRLGELEPGAFVDLALADGSSRRYQIVTRAQYGKLMLPREEIWRTTGPETLVLITCGGAFNPDIRRYTDNIVVTAAPVG